MGLVKNLSLVLPVPDSWFCSSQAKAQVTQSMIVVLVDLLTQPKASLGS